ncbi:hypothetical protein HK100_009630 [Physocladia obscura]|uniref:Kinesin light chain n=1 Tax=Physocladia obscura TaxID=109957 RepID=A0AAD5TBU8_9FUNG|nr:hypothetical protein HK100_009630 [Physocladia obscura]
MNRGRELLAVTTGSESRFGTSPTMSPINRNSSRSRSRAGRLRKITTKRSVMQINPKTGLRELSLPKISIEFKWIPYSPSSTSEGEDNGVSNAALHDDEGYNLAAHDDGGHLNETNDSNNVDADSNSSTEQHDAADEEARTSEINEESTTLLGKLSLDNSSVSRSSGGGGGSGSKSYSERSRLQFSATVDKSFSAIDNDKSSDALTAADLKALDTLRSTAAMFLDTAQWDAAEAELITLLEVEKSLHGPHHPSTIRTLDSLGKLYLKLGQTDMADECAMQVLFGRGTRFYESRQFDQAEAEYIKLIAMKVKYSQNDESVIVATVNLAKIYEQTGRVRLHGKYVMQSVERLAMLYDERGNFQAALSKYLQLLDLQIKRLGPEHPATLATNRKLAELYASVSDDEE